MYYSNIIIFKIIAYIYKMQTLKIILKTTPP